MNKNILVIGLGFSLWFTTLGYAKPALLHPCKDVRTACEAAGYALPQNKPGLPLTDQEASFIHELPTTQTENKHLFRNCIEPLIRGESVPGVKVAAATVSACKDLYADHPKK